MDFDWDDLKTLGVAPIARGVSAAVGGAIGMLFAFAGVDPEPEIILALGDIAIKYLDGVNAFWAAKGLSQLLYGLIPFTGLGLAVWIGHKAGGWVTVVFVVIGVAIGSLFVYVLPTLPTVFIIWLIIASLFDWRAFWN